MVPAAILQKMKYPGQYRPLKPWRGCVIQIKITNACSLDCRNCSVGVGLAKKLKKVFMMPPDDFRTACRSLKGYHGVIGVFGGLPNLHPKFEEICSIMREEVPDKEQRGLWSNDLFGHGRVCRETFNPNCSNLNVHQDQKAWDEIRRDWPEARPLRHGLTQASRHGPLFGSMLDLGISEAEMWERVGNCFINQTWSAAITMADKRLKGYFCEIAATMAELTGDASLGVDVVPGWWARPMKAFEAQVNHYCSKCLVAMNPRKVDAASGAAEQYTKVWAPVLATINGRAMQQVTTTGEIDDGEPATAYLPGVAPKR